MTAWRRRKAALLMQPLDGADLAYRGCAAEENVNAWIFGAATIILAGVAVALAAFLRGVPVDSGSGQWLIPLLWTVAALLFGSSLVTLRMALTCRKK